jgi:hypothetical protein
MAETLIIAVAGRCTPSPNLLHTTYKAHLLTCFPAAAPHDEVTQPTSVWRVSTM